MSIEGIVNIDTLLVIKIFISIGIGSLVGIERERSKSSGEFAGSRTFPLICLLGALTQAFFPSLLFLAAGFLGVLIIIAYIGKIVQSGDLGLTTAIASILVFIYGAMVTYSDLGLTIGVILGIITTTLLAAKKPVHEFSYRIQKEEIWATLQFLIISLVVFPILPDRNVDFLLGINPRFVWFMVIFVSGISFLAYLLNKIVDTGRGIGISGFLGGFVSSTATTVSMSNRSKEKSLSTICGFAIIIASTTMFPRALIEISVVNPNLLYDVIWPLGTMTITGSILSLYALYRFQKTETPDVDLDNPFELKSALIFGGIFAVILIISEYTSSNFGSTGVYLTAFFSGLADVDAITISLSRIALNGGVSESIATLGIVIGAIANTLVKAGIAWIFGTKKLAKLVTLALLTISLSGIIVAILM